jgi:hypothetical protein
MLLSCPLVLVIALAVNVQSGPAVGVAHQFPHHLYSFALLDQERCKRMPEGMPAHMLCDPRPRLQQDEAVAATPRRTIAETSLPSEPRQRSSLRRLGRDIQSAIAEGRRPRPRGPWAPQLGLQCTGGHWGTIPRFRGQMERLFGAAISTRWRRDHDGQSHAGGSNLLLAELRSLISKTAQPGG